MPDGVIGLLFVDVNACQPQPGFAGAVGARGVLQRGFVNFNGAVFVLNERNPGNEEVAVSFKIKVADFVLTVDDLGEIDFVEVFADQFLETVEFISVKFGFAVCPCSGDQGVAFQNGGVRHEMRIHVSGSGTAVAFRFFSVAALRKKDVGFLVRRLCCCRKQNGCRQQTCFYSGKTHMMSPCECYVIQTDNVAR